MAGVAPEHLVAPVAGERDGDVLTGEAGDEPRRDERRIRERFIEVREDRRDQPRDLLVLQAQIGVLRPEVLGDPARDLGLVVAGVGGTDGEGADRAVGRLLHERDDGGGVDAAGEERTQRDIGDHPRPDRALQQLVHRVDVLAVARRVRRPGPYLRPCGDGVDQRPPGALRPATVRLDGQDGAGRHLLDVRIDAHPAEMTLLEQARDGLGRHTTQRIPRAEGPGLGREPDGPVGPVGPRARHVQRLDAEPVADQVQAPLPPVVQREREHPDEARERRVEADPVARLEHHLGVGRAAQRGAPTLDVRPERSGLVALAVVDDDEAAGGGDHRLRAAGGEVDDREAALSEADPCLRVAPHPTVIRTAVVQRVAHRLEAGGESVGPHVATRRPQAGDPTHRSFFRCVGAG